MHENWWPWVVRVTWVSLPFAAGPLFGDALADTSRPVQVTATVGLWALWSVGLAMTMIPHALTLTAFRILAPASLVATIWATIDDGASGSAVIALAVTALAAVVSLAPAVGSWFVNGSSYGDEARVPLRPAGALLLAPVPLAWAITIATLAAGPLLLAARQWIVGALVLVLGGAASAIAVRALHVLSQRWVVFVPAGMVLHDQMVMAEPVLIKRNAIERLGPALDNSEATDLTMAALGLALEARLRTPVTLALRPEPGAAPEPTELDALLFSVSRPGRVLAEAERRRIRIG